MRVEKAAVSALRTRETLLRNGDVRRVCGFTSAAYRPSTKMLTIAGVTSARSGSIVGRLSSCRNTGRFRVWAAIGIAAMATIRKNVSKVWPIRTHVERFSEFPVLMMGRPAGPAAGGVRPP